ncbi:family 3 adenylate cyclase [Flammeovirgaceae bacterium 311]|nr:family 3 adenylate cyclase [Flammeovirgaceae bacterium 311]
MKKILLFFFLVLYLTAASAQISRLDSLEQAQMVAKDTTKANLLLEISKAYIGTDQKRAIQYAEQAMLIAQAYDFQKGTAYALKNIGLAYYVAGSYPEALEYWQKSLQAFVEINDKTGEANLLSNIGAVYFNQGWDAKAVEYYLKSLKVSEETGDKLRMATVLSNIGAVYNNNATTHNKALEYYLKALPLSEEIGYKAGVGTISANIGEIYLAKGKDVEALTYLNKAIALLEETNTKERVAFSLNNIGKVYARRGEFDKAMGYHQKALATAEAIPAKLEMTQSLIGIGQLYNKMGNAAQALTTFKRAEEIAHELGAHYQLKDAYDGLAHTYSQLGEYKMGFDYQAQLLAVKDTLYNTETNQKIVNLQANYESDKQQAQIDLLTKDKALQESALQQQKLEKYALLLGLLLILILAFVLFRNYQNKAHANRLLTLKNGEINEQKEELAAQRDYLEVTYHNLVNTQGQLVQAEKMASLGQLTAGVAHEINNPINFVSAGIDSLRANFTDIIDVAQQYFALKPADDAQERIRQLQRRKAEAEVEELIEESEQLFKTIKNGAVRTTEIVKSLRNFTRLDESNLKKADVHEGIDSTLVILNSQLKDRNIQIIKQYGELAPFNCYPGQLNQVFMNIISNAIQAMPAKGTIHIQTSTQAGWAVISIKDTGVGMSEEVKKRIFEPFYTTKDVGEGTGLGLSITYGIIEKHQGKIKVESTPGEGTAFILYLPLNLSESENQAPVEKKLVRV